MTYDNHFRCHVVNAGISASRAEASTLDIVSVSEESSLKMSALCDQFNNTASFLDLPLCLFADVSGSHDDWDLWYSALAEDFGVPEWEEVEDGCGIGFLV